MLKTSKYGPDHIGNRTSNARDYSRLKTCATTPAVILPAVTEAMALRSRLCATEYDMKCSPAAAAASRCSRNCRLNHLSRLSCLAAPRRWPAPPCRLAAGRIAADAESAATVTADGGKIEGGDVGPHGGGIGWIDMVAHSSKLGLNVLAE